VERLLGVAMAYHFFQSPQRQVQELGHGTIQMLQAVKLDSPQVQVFISIEVSELVNQLVMETQGIILEMRIQGAVFGHSVGKYEQSNSPLALKTKD
jgi:hypothetical protein